MWGVDRIIGSGRGEFSAFLHKLSHRIIDHCPVGFGQCRDRFYILGTGLTPIRSGEYRWVAIHSPIRLM